MQITITTPDTVVMENRQIDGVYVESDSGPTAILNRHASLITTSQLGTLRVVAANQTESYMVRGAILQMDNPTNTLTISALACDETGEVTQVSLQNYLEYLTKALAESTASHDSLKYQFLAGEKIAIERKVAKK